MRLPFLLFITITLTTALPGRFQQQVQFSRTSASYRNNELQHKSDEAGHYMKHGDTDGESEPQEQSQYLHQEYQKPGLEQEHLGVLPLPKPGLATIDLEKIKEEHQRLLGQVAGQSHSQFYQESSSFGSSHGLVRGRPLVRRPILAPKPSSTRGQLEEFENEGGDYSRYQSHGFGRDYLENTEGRVKPQIINKPVGGQRDLSTASSSFGAHHYSQTHLEDANEDEELTQQTQDGFEGLEFGPNGQNGKEKTENTQHGLGGQRINYNSGQTGQNRGITTSFDDHRGSIASGSHHKDDELTQQTQDGFEHFQFGSSHGQNRGTTGQTSQNRGVTTTYTGQRDTIATGSLHKDEDLTQQTQDGSKPFQFDSSRGQNRETIGQTGQKNRGTIASGSYHKDEDLTQQTQDGLEHFQFDSSRGQNRGTSGQTGQENRGTIASGSYHKDEDLTQQTQSGLEHFQFDSSRGQNRGTSGQNRGTSGQTGQENRGTIASGSHHKDEDLTQQTQSGLEHFQFDSSRGQNGGTIASGSQHKEEDLTQQTQDGFDHLYDSNRGQNRGTIGQENRGTIEFGSHHKDEDLTQQTQDGFDHLYDSNHGQNRGTIGQENRGTIEFGSHHKDEDLTQQTQDGFDHLYDSNHGQNRGTGSQIGRQYQRGTEFGADEDLTQQTQDGLEHFGQTNEHRPRQQGGQGGFRTQINQFGRDQGIQIGRNQYGSQLGQNKPVSTNIPSRPKPESDSHLHNNEETTIYDELLEISHNNEAKLNKDQGKIDEHKNTEYGKEDKFLVVGGQHSTSQHGHIAGQSNWSQSSVGQSNSQYHWQEGQITGHGQRESGYKPQDAKPNRGDMSNTGKDEQHGDMTQQTGFGKLETGNQGHFGSQQTQENLEFGHHRDMTQQSQQGFGNLEIGNQEKHREKDLELSQQTQNFGLEFGHEDMTQQSQQGFGNLEIGNQEKHKEKDSELSQQTQNFGLEFGHEDMTQQSQQGFGNLEIGNHGKPQQKDSELSQQTQNFGLEFGHEDMTQQSQQGFGQDLTQTGQNHRVIGKLESGQSGIQESRGHRQYSSSFSGSSSYSQSSSHHGQAIHYGQQSYENNPEETDDIALKEIEQYAKQLHDVSQQAQKPETVQFEKIEESDFNQESSRDILNKDIIEPREPIIISTTKKPGFWKRVGSSITTTYESAKEKTKELAGKIKHNVG